MSGVVLGGEMNSLIVAGLVFLATFTVLLAGWSMVLRALFSTFGKSRWFFLPRTFKELFFSFAFIFMLVSLFVATLFVDRELLTGDFFKIWQVLLIFAVANIATRVVLTGLDVQHRKVRDRSGIYRSIGLLKSTTGLILYLIAGFIAIYVLSAELGAAVMIIGFFLVLLVFAAGFPQMKSIVAGLQLGDYYVDVGSMVSIDGKRGFVEGIYGRSTVVKTLEGKTIVIPNYHFFDRRFEIEPEDQAEVEARIEIAGKDVKKIKERLSAISSKTAISLQEIPNEFKPRVHYAGVSGGSHVFLAYFRIVPFSDIRKLADIFGTELAAEFGERVQKLDFA